MDTENFEQLRDALEKKEVVLQETIAKVHNLRKTVAELEQSNNTLKEHKTKLENERRDLQNELDTKLIECDELANKVSDLQNELSTKLIEYDELSNKVLHLQNELRSDVEIDLNLIRRKRDINAKKRK
jgi:hypothetical protein